MKIYTKTGDTGETGLFAGRRVSKDDPRIEAIGSVDELNAFIGWARSSSLPPDIDPILANVQHELFALGAELGTPEPAKHGTDFISDVHITALEGAIDRFEANLPPLKQFILPGGTSAAAALHVARSVCRRAERNVVAFSHEEATVASRPLVTYLNRLSDLLFVLARAANHQAGRDDIAWEKPG